MNRGPIQPYPERSRKRVYPGPQYGISLLLYTPVLLGKNYSLDLTRKAVDWRRTIRLQGGYWQGTFRIYDTLPVLVDYFYNWLGWHIEESVLGVTSWEGMVYEMVLNTPNASRVRSLDQMFNYAKVKYVDSSDVDQITSAGSVQSSIDRYGRREAIEDVGKFDLTSAEAMRATYLAERAWPWARPQASGGDDVASLDVTVCGYAFTANWRYTSQADDATDTVHDWLSDILTNDCATFLTVGTLAANTTAVERSVTDYERCWDLMKKLVGVGDASGNLYRLHVGSGRYIYYEQVDKTQLYYIVKGQICDRLMAAEALNPWFVRPGVFRDMDYPVSYTETGSYLGTVRDILAEEVSVGVKSGLTWQALDFSESAQLAAFQEYAAERTAAEGGAGGGRTTRQPTVTEDMLRRMGTTRGKWAKLKPEQRRKMKRKLKK